MRGWWPRSGPSISESRSPLWALPSAAAVAATLLALVVVRLGVGNGVLASFVGDVDAASGLLQTTATSVMTAATLTFSLTVVALQLASQQFSPRLLREFTHDATTKRVLALLAAAFSYSVTVLVALDAEREVPRVAVLIAGFFALGSLGAILSFITHIVRMIRVDSMMLMVHDDSGAAIEQFYPPYEDRSRRPDELALDEAAARKLCATRSGFVQKVDVERLVEVAAAAGLLVRLEVRPGDHLVRQTPMASVWVTDGASDALDGDLGDLEEQVQTTLTIGYERSMDQDVAFGLRQLEDIAVKAMSPAINDPVTADHAVGHMGDLLVRLLGCRLGATVHLDDRGASRAIVPDRDLRYYLELCCGQLRRFGADEPTVLVSLLRMLRDVAVACRDDHQREELRRAARLVATENGDLRDADAETVKDLLERVELALAGAVTEAFADRAGETRSI